MLLARLHYRTKNYNYLDTIKHSEYLIDFLSSLHSFPKNYLRAFIGGLDPETNT